MKKVMLGFCLLLGSAVAVCAQDTTSTSNKSKDQYRTQQDEYSDKEVIATSDLPQPVRDQIQGQDYTGWTVSKAYRKQKEGKTLYAVELMNGTEKKVVKFDAQGNKLKEKKKD